MDDCSIVAARNLVKHTLEAALVALASQHCISTLPAGMSCRCIDDTDDESLRSKGQCNDCCF